jgi:hypothetical protein
MSLVVARDVTLFVALLVVLARGPRGDAPLSRRVLLALVAGAAFGAALQAVHGHDAPALRAALDWIGVVGTGYVRLLQLVVAPLVFVSVLAAVVRLRSTRTLGTIGAGVTAVLLATTAVAALIGVAVARLFVLDATTLVRGAREVAKGDAMLARLGEAQALSVPALLQSLVPVNAVAELAGTRPTSVIGVVLVALLVGVATLALRERDADTATRITDGVETLQRLVLEVVRVVLRLTPYGVAALMARTTATASVADIALLGRFLVASYVGLAAILLVHLALVAAAGTGVRRHLAAVWPTLVFAFTARSSAATLPLTVATQVDRLGVPRAVAGMAASIGTIVGQNGCAGLYPAMLAVMIAPSVGVDASAWPFIGAVVTAATVGSIGIAGVGGGATIAALVVLSALDLPVALAGVLIAIEPLIDMGRTAINVSGAITAGTVAGRFVRERDDVATEADRPMLPVQARPA